MRVAVEETGIDRDWVLKRLRETRLKRAAEAYCHRLIGDDWDTGRSVADP